MHSVILTELGISVYQDENCIKSFPFENAAKDYLGIKKYKFKVGFLVDYLVKTQHGFTVNDESLTNTLKKKEVDVQLMTQEKIEKIQANKLQILIDAGFAKDQQDVKVKLREFAMQLSSSTITEVSENLDLHAIQAIGTLDEVDKMINLTSHRLREWYGLHFPELGDIVDGNMGYAKITLAGKRDDLTKQVFEDVGFLESQIEMLLVIKEKSRGGDISEKNLAAVQVIAKQLIELNNLRKTLEDRIIEQMEKVAPNLSTILGATLSARMIGHAGSLNKFATMPASTIQILGAEKALFRSIKTGSNPPKYGLLFQHALIHAAPKWQRGKIARAVASKAAIASRVDMYGEGVNETLLEKLNVRIDEIDKKYKEPPPEKEIIKPRLQRDGKKDFRFNKRTSKGKANVKSKRKRFGKR